MTLSKIDDNTYEYIDVSISDQQDQYIYGDQFAKQAKVFESYKGLGSLYKKKIAKSHGIGASSKNAELKYYETYSGYDLFNVEVPPYNMEELASFYDSSPVNHGAVDAKVANIVGLGYNFVLSQRMVDRVQALTSDEQRAKLIKKIERMKTDVAIWIEELNHEDSFHHILHKVATDVEVFGNGYIEVGRTVTGEIGYVGHIPASTIRIRRRRDGYIQIVGNQVTYFRNFATDTPSPINGDTRPNELLHIKIYSPISTFYGVPDSVSCRTSIVGDSLAAAYNLKFFSNAATPRYIITITGGRLSRASEDKLFRFLQTSLRGDPHRTLLVPLPLDSNGNPVKFEMKAVDVAVHDGSWENYRSRNRNDILTAHGVPETRIGGSTEEGTGAAALSSDRMFKEQVVVPSQEIFVKALNRIILEKTDALLLNLEQLTLTDELASSQIHERYARNKILTINEIREKIDYPSIPEGDKFFEPSSQTVAEQNAQANQSRERDKERVANNSDSVTTITGRNPKGAGSKEDNF